MTPFLTRTFTVNQYGAIDLIYTTVLIIALLANINLDTALLRFYHNEKYNKKTIITSVFILSAILSIIFCLISFLLFIFLKGLIFKSAEEFNALVIALFSIPFVVILTNELTLLRVQRKAYIFVLISFLNLITVFLLTVLFVKYTSWGIKSFFIAMLISYGLISLGTIYYFKESFSFSFLSAKLRKEMLSFGLPLLLPALVGTFLGSVNKYILQFYHNFATVATFAIGLRLSMAVTFIAIPFRQAWFPYVFSIIDKKDDVNTKIRFCFIFRIFIILLFGIITATLIFAKQIVLLISNKNYLSALPVIGYVCLGATFISLSGSFFNLGIFRANKTIYSLIAYSIGFLVNFILAIILIPEYSIVGAGISLLCGHFVTAMLLFYFSNKFYKIAYDLKLLFSLSLIYLIFSIILNKG